MKQSMFDPRQTDLDAFGQAVEQQLAEWTAEEGGYSTELEDWRMDFQDAIDAYGRPETTEALQQRLVKMATYAAVLWAATQE